MDVLWLLAFSIFLVIESASFNLITVWFALGAFGAFITSYLTTNVLIQCLVFVAVSAISLILTRPLVKKLLKKGHIRTNLDSVVGQIGFVDETIKPKTGGRVVVMGKNWAARSDKLIKEGSRVEVLAIDGVKLIVKKEEK